MFFQINIVFSILLLIFNDILICGSRLFVKKFKNCDLNINYSGTYNLTFSTVNNKQYLDGTYTLQSHLDNTLRVNGPIDILAGAKYMYLFSITERKSCNVLHKYFGEFIYNLERHAQLIPGMCPIPEGRYQWHNLPMDFETITTLVNFPFGNLRFTIALYRPNNSIFECSVYEVEHRII